MNKLKSAMGIAQITVLINHNTILCIDIILPDGGLLLGLYAFAPIHSAPDYANDEIRK